MFKLKKLMRNYKNCLKNKWKKNLKKRFWIYQLKVKVNIQFYPNPKTKKFNKAVNLIFQIIN